ncbi:unnamed protein product [Cyclocybe aegerita]|uniref:Uncharacterized protein n=1 Tax=Cyclocybe aegerita TaxID=1973307 RepID=A0A8S0WYA1_CYCAE|nr:unnamed protein product [Cyclocybe aegerita]
MAVLSRPLPLEIWMKIVELHKSDKHTLRALSRCCRSLAPLCQRILFNDLRIPRLYPSWPSDRAYALARLEDAFTQSPHLAAFVRSVFYVIEDEDGENTSVHWILGQLKHLTDAEVHYVPKELNTRLDWGALDMRLCSSIMHVIQSPNLRCLTLTRIKNMPSSLFRILASSLAILTLDDVEVEEESSSSCLPDSEVASGPVQSRIPQIKHLYFYDRDTAERGSRGVLCSRPFIFDFKELGFLHISWGNERESALAKELMKTASKLKGASFQVDSPLKTTAGVAQAILDYCLDDLTVLTFGLSHRMPTSQRPVDNDPFLGLAEEFQLLSGRNKVKFLSIHFHIPSGHLNGLTFCLSRLDDAIADAFPHLEHFDLQIWVYFLRMRGRKLAFDLEALADEWTDRNRLQFQKSCRIPGLRFDCRVHILDA